MARRETSEATAAKFLASRRRRQRAETPVERPTPKPRPAYVPAHERMPLTAEQIEAQRVGAVAKRDQFFAKVCERAAAGEVEAINAVKAAVYGLG